MSPKPESWVATIQPELAKEWLKKAAPNREVSWSTVARYARMMANGEWNLDGMTIKFDDSDRLIDGQHRLLAVVKADATIKSFVVRGLESKVFWGMDRGRGRTVGQTLHLDGLKNGTTIAAAALVLYHDIQGAMGRPSWSLRLEPSELKKIISDHPGLADAVAAVKTVCGKFHCPPGTVAWCYYRFAQEDAVLTEAFFSALFSGDGLQRGDPVYLLRDRLIENAGARAKMSHRDVAAVIIRAWNATAEGRPLRNVRVPRRGIGAEPFPEVTRLRREEAAQ